MKPELKLFHFKCNPPKYPDLSPTDFWAFGLTFETRSLCTSSESILDRLWDNVLEEQNNINRDISRKSLFYP